MADDREILREIWDGKVPVCFTLSSEETVSLEKPEALYLLVPRQSYFPLVTDVVHRHFQRFIDVEAQQNEMWLECEGQALKWHSPIGVLFDLSGADNHLPWNITVHFQNFPELEIMHCPNKDVVEAYLMATIKEADCLKHRGQIMNTMQKKEHKQLWMGLSNDKFDQFWAVNRKLMECGGEDLFKSIPFRIHQGDQPVLQKLFKPVCENGQLAVLNDLLECYVPNALDGGCTQKVLIQGIEAPMEATLQWLSEHFSHPDNFLHISVVPV